MLLALFSIVLGILLAIFHLAGEAGSNAGRQAYIKKHNYNPVRQGELEYHIRSHPKAVTAETGIVYDCDNREEVRKAMQWYADKEGWNIGPMWGEGGYTNDIEYLRMARVPKDSPAWKLAKYREAQKRSR